MPARQRVLAALGQRCAWCGAADGPLEIDHVHGGGTRHRHRLGKRIEYWLCDAYDRTGVFPSGYQLLCRTCHDMKSGRVKKKMADNTYLERVTISLPKELHATITKLGSRPNTSKSLVMQAALEAYLNPSHAQESLLTGVHERLDRLVSAIETLERRVHQLETMEHRDVGREMSSLKDSFVRLYDYMHRQDQRPITVWEWVRTFLRTSG